MNDLRLAFRQLLKNPVISCIAILTLALGIGANTAIFSVMNALMLRLLPVADPSRLVLFGNGDSMGSMDGFPNGSTTLFSYPMFRELHRNNQIFSDVAAIKSLPLTVHGRVAGGQELEKIQIRLVSGSYFPLLGLVPQEGRLFTDADDQIPRGHPIAVASDSWWTRRFANEPFSLGKTITIGSTVYSIVGVTPRKFFGTTVGESPDFWIPLTMEAQISPGWNGLTNKFFQSLHVIGRLKSKADIARAETEINLLFKRTLQDYAGPQPTKKELEDLQHARIDLTPAATGLSQLREQFSKPLSILMSVVAMVLLIACANIANLMLARATARQREIAIRMAVGATRWRLIRQLLSESPIGQRFRIGGPDAGPDNEREIIGVVKDAKYENLREADRAAAYYPYSQKIQYLGDFEIRFSGDPGAAISAVRATVAQVDSNLPISDARTMLQEIGRSIVDQRLIAQISGFFALLALFLACIGIYGVTSYAVTQQTREIGIRIALGAQRKQVLSLILRQTLFVLAAGLSTGIPAVLATQRLISTQLYGLRPLDPVSISVSSALLIGAAIVAGYLPARQATKVDPMEALRYE